jgi:ornithine carbamoyltransferase
MRHLLEIDDLKPSELLDVLAAARQPDPPQRLRGRGVALLFEKPSARTRHSMEVAVVQLGGHPVTMRKDEVDLDVRESVEDVTRVLACYHAVLGARVFDHAVLERMAALDVLPVVNLLSDVGHPMQALADVLTLQDEFGSLEGRTVAWVGDANNVLLSLALACGMLGAQVRSASPAGYRFDAVVLDRIAATGPPLVVCDTPQDAAQGADAVYTDVWTSMGQEDERQERLDAFAGYQVDDALVQLLAPQGIVLHCLPAHRGEEISAGAIDGPRSRVWPQAANRMHAARGLLAWLLEQNEEGAS